MQMSRRRQEVRRRTAHAVGQLERSQREIRRGAGGEQRLPDRAVHAVAPLRDRPVLRTAGRELAQIRDRLDRLGRALLLPVQKKRHATRLHGRNALHNVGSSLTKFALQRLPSSCA